MSERQTVEVKNKIGCYGPSGVGYHSFAAVSHVDGKFYQVYGFGGCCAFVLDYALASLNDGKWVGYIKGKPLDFSTTYVLAGGLDENMVKVAEDFLHQFEAD